MKLNTFAGAAKEIIFTSLAALVLFALLAAQDAKAYEPLADKPTQLAESIALVTHLEQSVIKAKGELAKTQANYEAGNASIEEMFFVTLRFHDIEDSLVNARASLLVKLAQYNDTAQVQFAKADIRKTRID